MVSTSIWFFHTINKFQSYNYFLTAQTLPKILWQGLFIRQFLFTVLSCCGVVGQYFKALPVDEFEWIVNIRDLRLVLCNKLLKISAQ